MEDIINNAKEMLKHIIGKTATVIGTFVLGTNFLPSVINYITPIAQSGTLTNTLPVQVLLLGLGYKVWIEAIVPFITSLFNQKGTAAKPNTYSKIF